MIAWLRLLQVLYMHPKSGPLLIMAIRMLDDLVQFLMLASFVLVAFCAAFFVLFNGCPTATVRGRQQQPQQQQPQPQQPEQWEQPQQARPRQQQQ